MAMIEARVVRVPVPTDCPWWNSGGVRSAWQLFSCWTNRTLRIHRHQHNSWILSPFVSASALRQRMRACLSPAPFPA